MKKYLVPLFLLVITISSCSKKYPEGPVVTFRSPSARIVGVWNFESYLVDGVDSSQLLNYCLTKELIVNGEYHPNPNSFFFKFLDPVDSSLLFTNSGKWSFKNDYQTITLNVTKGKNSIPLYGPFNAGTTDFDIQKLSYHQFWFNASNNGVLYEFRFTK